MPAGREPACEDGAVIDFIGPLRVALEPADSENGSGPLARLPLAVKDVFDVAGVATGAGNPAFLAAAAPAAQHAVPVARLVQAGAVVIGKAHTDEFAFSLSGTNAHYGTPRNVSAPGRVPGGSSSGSGAAVAAGLARIALGTDTAGSTRVPASYCGVYGLRPTHGRVPLAGVLPLAPSFDTCGVLADTGELLERAALSLLDGRASQPPEALVLASDLLAEADPPVGAAIAHAAAGLARQLDVPLRSAELAAGRHQSWLKAFRGRQLVEVWRALGAWIESHRPPLGPGVAARFAAAKATPERDGIAATAVRAEVLEALDRVLPARGALILPATATVAPPPTLSSAGKEDLRARTMRLTCVAGLAGAPAASLPLATVGGLPVGVSIVARPGEDERLLAAARAISDPEPGT
ncbi:MAG TPA: amidase [Solirubrobacteraceae bacterium]